MLAAEAVSVADGGGKTTAARRPVWGRARVARYLAGGLGRFAGALDVGIVEINGEPAVWGWAGARLVGVAVPEFAGEQIVALRIVVNPDKLGFLAGQAAALSHSTGVTGPSS
ncbi:hypothetical protein [Pseudonocardia parietis]|uniref:IclR-ED domain-containing protein n=1 Tax=Pseudonocardia parietis TaxID=570936 RepID=A0ABS4VMG0_9PSEU|nr:hypothetical protein [Pseudonocardia parietis]MBP2365115.1 hypothetical protein [Pseudonocardia parietis]